MRRSIIRVLRVDGAVLLLAAGLLLLTGHDGLARYPLGLGIVLLVVALFLDFLPNQEKPD